MRRSILVASIVLTAAVGGVGWWMVTERDAAVSPVIAVPPPPPPGPPVVVVDVPGSSGALMPVADPDAGILSDTGVAGLRAYADKSGSAALLVWHAGALQLEHYAPSVQAGDRLDGEGLVPGLMALLTGVAVKDGTLQGIDDPISRYLPEWDGGDPRGRVTVRHLLEGSSGLDAPTDAPGRDAVAWTLSAGLSAEPGTRFAPSLFEPQVLGLVLARARGQALIPYLSDVLWKPMGARSAVLDTGAGTNMPYLHAGMKATARDWLRVGLLLLDNGMVGQQSLVPVPWLDLMERPTSFSRNDGWRVRLGWPFDRQGPIRASNPFSEGDTIFLGAEGQGARLYVSKGRDLVVLRLGPPAKNWDEAELPNLAAKSITTAPASFRSENGMKVQRARDLNGKVEMPPIKKPPPVPSVTVEPLDDVPSASGSPGGAVAPSLAKPPESAPPSP